MQSIRPRVATTARVSLSAGKGTQASSTACHLTTSFTRITSDVPTSARMRLLPWFCHHQAAVLSLAERQRTFSSKQQSPPPSRGRSTPQLLSFDVIRKIKQDLVQADTDQEGRLNFEGLKRVLRKYHAFSDAQVEQIGEMFYIGTSGQSVRHSTFLRALQHIACAGGDTKDSTLASAAAKNPLQLTSLDDNRCFISPHDSPYYEIQKRFDGMMLNYIRQVNLVEEIGGPEVLRKAEVLFWSKIRRDDRLAPFFQQNEQNDETTQDDMPPMLRMYMSIAFSRNIPAANQQTVYQTVAKRVQPIIQQQSLNEEHFDLLLEYFVETLQELQIDSDIIDMVMEMILSFRYIFATKLLEHIGGDDVVRVAQDMFYDKLTRDDRLARFFVGIDVDVLKRKNMNFISIVFSKPNVQKMNYIRSVHDDMVHEKGLGVEHFDILMGHFVDTLAALNVEQKVIDTAMHVVESYRPCFEKEYQPS